MANVSVRTKVSTPGAHTPSPRVHTGCFRTLHRGMARTRSKYGPSELLGIFPRFRQLHTNIMREVRLRAFLKALKYSRRPDLPDCIDILLAEAPALHEKDLVVILTYLDKGPTALNNKVIHEALLRLVPDRTEQIMGSLTQPYYDKGKAEGEAKGEAKILTRLLERRFGTLSDPLRQRIFAADVGSIEAWVERAFDAPDLQSIFDSN
jgi:hypothetical protein